MSPRIVFCHGAAVFKVLLRLDENQPEDGFQSQNALLKLQKSGQVQAG